MPLASSARAGAMLSKLSETRAVSPLQPYRLCVIRYTFPREKVVAFSQTIQIAPFPADELEVWRRFGKLFVLGSALGRATDEAQEAAWAGREKLAAPVR